MRTLSSFGGFLPYIWLKNVITTCKPVDTLSTTKTISILKRARVRGLKVSRVTVRWDEGQDLIASEEGWILNDYKALNAYSDVLKESRLSIRRNEGQDLIASEEVWIWDVCKALNTYSYMPVEEPVDVKIVN